MNTTYTDFQRYLAAKKSVDDRALNHQVWTALQARIQQSHAQAVPFQIVEIGAGIGTMVERMLDRGRLHQASYTIVDAIADNIATARSRLPKWAVANGFTVTQHGGDDGTIQISQPATANAPAVACTVQFVVADCFAYAAETTVQGTADLLIAHALLDLFDIAQALPKLVALLNPAGLLYTTINFDGNTILQPEIDRQLDDQIEAAYHATMDARITDGAPSGDSRAGRHLFGHLRHAGLTILNAGSSDWVVYGDPRGYPADEAYFLHFIVNTMAGALANTPTLDQASFAAWIKKRHAQIERGKLVYIAHQLDFLAER